MGGANKRVRAIVVLCASVLLAVGLVAVFSPEGDRAPEAASVLLESVPADQDAYVPGELIVGLADAGVSSAADRVRADIEAAGFSVSSILAETSDHAGTMLLVSTGGSRDKGDALTAAAQELAKVRGVERVQPNYRFSAATRASEVAQDEDVGEQYYLNDWATSKGANVAEAWKKTSSKSRVDVAVLDTGVYVMQEYSNDGSKLVVSEDNYHQEFDGANLDLDDGRDFVHSVDNSTPQPLVNTSNPYGDDNGHGTHVSAIIAANAKTPKTPNALPYGMAGVSQNARVIPIKVLDAGGNGDTADFISAYSYLIGKKRQGRLPNLRVVNMSFSLTFDGDDSQGSAEGVDNLNPTEYAEGDYEYDGPDDASGGSSGGSSAGSGSSGGDAGNNTALLQQIRAAEALGIVTVCAAGNDGSAARTYPSDYEECVSVTALDANGRNASYSNINQYKDISAPGNDIYSAWGSQADAYVKLSGTSQATAIVSGIFSLLWANKANMTVEEAKEAVYCTAHEVPGANEGLGVMATPEADESAGGSLGTLKLSAVVNGSYGAVDAAAALDYVPAADEDDDEPEPEPELVALPKEAAKLAKTTLTYTGKKLTPAVTVTVNGRTLEKGEDYTVTYKNNVKPGTATATVVGEGDYEGTLICNYKIVLGKTKVKKLKVGKRAFAVQWSRQKSGKVGYQVRYSLKKNMKRSKSKLVTKNKTTKLKVAKLKKGKKYYVQVRAYKKIGKKKYYSAWSAKKAVKVK